MRFSLLKTTLGITLTLALRSHKAWLKYWISMEHEIVGHPGSFFFFGKSSITTLHSYVSLTTSVDGIGCLLLMMSLMYLA